MMRISGILLVLITISFCGCNEEEILSESKEEFALSLFDGVIRENQSETEEGENVWKVKMENEEGAIVELYIARNEDRVVRIDGENGPFTYDIDPKLNLKTFSQAKITAVTALKNDNLEKWRLRKEDSYQNKFVYTFEFDASDNEDEVEIDAKSGQILSVD